jgi:hypothetical protein
MLRVFGFESSVSCDAPDFESHNNPVLVRSNLKQIGQVDICTAISAAVYLYSGNDLMVGVNYAAIKVGEGA